MSSQLQEHLNSEQQVKRKKRGDSKLNKQIPRYQCYCERIYLSYPALYLHLKNKHPQCFINNRKIQVTKFREIISPQGYKIHKMEKDNSQINKFQQQYNIQNAYRQKANLNYQFQNFQSYPYQVPPNFMMPPLQTKNFFMENSLPQSTPISQPFNQNTQSFSQNVSQFIPPQPKTIKNPKQTKSSEENIQNQQKQSKQNIIKIFNQYISQTANKLQLQKKQILQLQILFTLLTKFLKQKTQKLKVIYQISGNLLKNQNIKCLEIVVPYFKEKYFPAFFKEINEKDPQRLTKEQKWIKLMSKTDQNIFKAQNSIEKLQNFEKWLISCQYIKKFEVSNEL